MQNFRGKDAQNLDEIFTPVPGHVTRPLLLFGGGHDYNMDVLAA